MINLEFSHGMGGLSVELSINQAYITTLTSMNITISDVLERDTKRRS